MQTAKELWVIVGWSVADQTKQRQADFLGKYRTKYIDISHLSRVRLGLYTYRDIAAKVMRESMSIRRIHLRPCMHDMSTLDSSA